MFAKIAIMIARPMEVGTVTSATMMLFFKDSVKIASLVNSVT